MEFLEYSCRLGDLILKKLDKNPNLNGNQLAIYNGRSGLILFFMELYKQSGNTEYLNFISREAEILRRDSLDGLGNISFYTGKLGVAYILSQCSLLLGDSRLSDRAMEIARKTSSNREATNGSVSDLLGGSAGTILALIHLHTRCNQEWIIELLHFWFKKLLSQINLSRNGIYFDRYSLHESGLCGFAHGGSGIAFVLFELANYFGNDAFHKLAELLISHEDSYYDSKSQNWMDLRHLDRNTQIIKDQLKKHNRVVNYPKAPLISLWCNGAPGISLTALRGLEITGDIKYKRILRNGLDNTRDSLRILNNYPLCHGLAGNASVLLQAYDYLNEPDIAEIHRVAEIFVQMRPSRLLLENKFYKVNSLFTGPAGIGYFLLNLSNKAKMGSIIYPKVIGKVPSKSNLFSRLSESDITLMIYENVYPKTLFFVNKLKGKIIGDNNSRDNFRDNFHKPIEKTINKIGVKYLTEVFKYERIIAIAKFDCDNNYLSFLEKELELERCKKLIFNKKLWSTCFRLSKDIFLISTEWDWTSPFKWKRNASTPGNNYFVICIRHSLGSSEYLIDEETFKILRAFKKTGTIKYKVVNLSKVIKPFSEIPFNKLTEFIEEQIKVAIGKGFIIPQSDSEVHCVTTSVK